MKKSFGEKVFYTVNEIFLIIVATICLIPLVHIFAISFSSNDAVTTGKVLFVPKDFNIAAYEYIMANAMFWRAMGVSVVRVILGVGVNLLFTILCAYPLSKKNTQFHGRTFYAWFFFIPMVLNGGLIPTYFLVKELHLTDSIFALILPAAVPVFYVLILLNFYRTLPAELEEAAIVDGAGQWTILIKVIVPLSLPSLATISVYAILGHWNSWFDGMIYMNSPLGYPLMTFLQTSVLQIDPSRLTAEEAQSLAELGSRSFKCAQIFVACIPVLFTYPFFQKYFVKGMVLGSVKG